MEGKIRPFRKVSVSRLAREAVAWRGERRALIALSTELEFRHGRGVSELKTVINEQLRKAEWDDVWERQDEWERCHSLGYVLRGAEPRIQTGLTLLQAAGFPLVDRSQAPVPHGAPLRRAIAWDDGGRITHATGGPRSIERCGLLIDLFTLAIRVVRAKGLACGGSAEDRWPQDRALVVRTMQRQLRLDRQGA